MGLGDLTDELRGPVHDFPSDIMQVPLVPFLVVLAQTVIFLSVSQLSP